MNGESILIVEDDAVVIRGLERQFRSAGYKVVALFSTSLALGVAVMFWGFIIAGRPPATSPSTHQRDVGVRTTT